MNAEVLGISGSPIKNSNTDRLVNAILDATGRELEFVKLSRINVRPWFACVTASFPSVLGSHVQKFLLLKFKTAQFG